MPERIPESLREFVKSRAKDRCEYCLIHQVTQAATFHIDHCLPVSKGGRTVLDNLALACPHCDRNKWDHVTSRDPRSGKSCRIYNPRAEKWMVHFRFLGFKVIGITATGRATVKSLMLNHRAKTRIRELEEALGFFPPH